jgi:hypothetical protein
VYPILLVVVVECHLSRNAINVGEAREWGQSVAIIICACGTLRWAYVNLPLLRHLFRCIRYGAPTDPILPTNFMRFLRGGMPPPYLSKRIHGLVTPEEFPDNPIRLPDFDEIWRTINRRG